MVPGFCWNVYMLACLQKPSDRSSQPDYLINALLLLHRIDRSLFAVSAESFKAKDTVACRKECVVAALAYVCAGMDLCTSLTNKHVACENKLTVSSLDAKTLGFGISAVLGGTHTFFMSEKLYIYLQHY